MKILKLLAVTILMGIVLISCNSPESTLLTSLKTQNVVISNGVNFETGQPVVFSPFLINQVNACRSFRAGNKKSLEGCDIEIVDNDNSGPILDAIKISRSFIKGEIRKNGEVKPARFFVTVTALYEGSKCGTVWMGGQKYYCCNTGCTLI